MTEIEFPDGKPHFSSENDDFDEKYAKIQPGSVWRRVGGNDWVEHVVVDLERVEDGALRVIYRAIMDGIAVNTPYTSGADDFLRGFALVHGPTAVHAGRNDG